MENRRVARAKDRRRFAGSLLLGLARLQGLEMEPLLWEPPRVKLRTDDRARLYGRDILKPNTDYQADLEGNRIVLVELVPKKARAPRPRLVKKHGYAVAVGNRPITQEDVRKALNEFP